MKPPKSLKEMEAELGGLGTEYTITVKLAGVIDFGSEVQLELTDGLLTYIPTDSFKASAVRK